MKKILSYVYLLAALFMIGAAITSCSKSDDTPAPEPKPVGPTTYTMTIKATKGGDAKTRALNLDGNTLTASWSTSENVYVQKGSDWATGSLKPQADGGTAVLKGSLSGITIAENDNLFLQFPKSGDITYEGQLGTLNDIAANFDWATATVEVKSVSPSGDITPKAATTTFTNKQAIIKFTLVDKANDAAISPSALTVTDGTSTVSLTNIPAATYTANEATNVLFVAFPAAETAKTITLTAIVGNNIYTYEKSDATFYNGRYYAINVKMTKTGVYYPTPLTLECCATDGAAAVWVTDYSNLEYKVDDGEWATYSINQINLSNGQKVSFRGTNSTTGSSQYMQIHCNDNCYIYGNIMSLLDPSNFATMTTLPYDNTFQNLFMDNIYITHTNGKDLVLPATTLRTQCYSSMFYGCTKLNHIKCLATDISATNCTSNWVYNAGNLAEGTKTFVIASSAQAAWKAKEDNSGIPYGWTVTTE